MVDSQHLSALKCIVFDVDGVLLDSWGLMRFALAGAHAACGVRRPVSEEAFRRLLGRPLPEIAQRLGLPPEFVPAYQRISRTHPELTTLYEGVPELLQSLHSNHLRLALNTGKDRSRTLEILRQFGIEGFFDSIVTSDDVRRGKPAPESLQRAMAKTGAASAETAFVGDSPVDVACALACGVLPIAAGWGLGEVKELIAAGAVVVAEDVCELRKLILDSSERRYQQCLSPSSNQLGRS
ncbi:MAG: HAD family hydrolase [bacterium]|nr:HAD family hydrolase [bacterium]